MAEDPTELQLLPTTPTSNAFPPSLAWSSESVKLRTTHAGHDAFEAPSLDLQLSISVRPLQHELDSGGVEAVRWQAAEQIRLAAAESAYAERVRELSRREMESARSELARARRVWERAREEVEKAEMMKEMATRRIDSSFLEITCQSCRQKFRP
ncbi:hypothetical protein NMG60_11002829 [Bertholletia excelsa]